MLRKHKVALSILIYLPLAIIVPILLNIKFTQNLSLFTKTSYLFALPCLILFALPFKKYCIDADQTSATHSTIRWILTVFAIEIGFFALWLNQNALFLQNILSTNNINLLAENTINKTLLTDSFLNWGLFPWTLICFIAITFSILVDKQKAYSPFSLFVPKWFTTFIYKVSKTAIDNYISVATRFFLSFNIIFLALRCCHFLTRSTFTPIDGMVIFNILILIFLGKSFQQTLNKLEKRKLPLGGQYIFMLMLIIPICLATKFFIYLLPQMHLTILNKHLSNMILALQNSTLTWKLWNWSWWILGAPLASSLLIKFSSGRKIRSFISVVLALPVFLLLLNYLTHNQLGIWLTTITKINIFSLAPFILSTLFILYLIINAESTYYLWMGFFPVRKPKKLHEERLAKIRQQLWLFTILLLGLTLVGGMVAIQLITIPITLVCLMIFLIMMFLIPFKKNWQ